MPGDLPLSVLVLARDEGAALERLIARLAFAAEIVVVWDPAGDPRTRVLAERAGARVHERALTDGFGAQRRFALERCTQPCVLWIDADEWPDDLLLAAIAREVRAARGPFVADVLRATWFLDREIRHCGWDREWLPRLFWREGASFDDARVHERLLAPPAAVRRRCAGRLEHHSYPDWDTCVTKLVRYSALAADAAWQRGRRAAVADLALRPPLRFLRMYVLQGGVLDGAHGLVVCLLAATQVFLRHAQLWSRARTKEPA